MALPGWVAGQKIRYSVAAGTASLYSGLAQGPVISHGFLMYFLSVCTIDFAPAAEGEAGPKLVRLLYFVGAGFICTAAINKWRELEQKSILRQHQKGQSLETPSPAVQNAVE